MVGQTVKTIPVSAKGKLNIPIETNGSMKSGLYILNVTNESGSPVGTARLSISGASY
jgi:hypothetical protein